MKLINWLQSKFKAEETPYIAILLLVFLAIVASNFPYGRWLTGWDNLHPEFNFGHNLKTGIFSVWQENQGLGLSGGHGFAATIPHILTLFLLSLIIPTQYARPVFTFFMLGVGAIGTFYLTAKLIPKQKVDFRYSSALLGGLFYMLNFGTVQMLYIPLEAFVIHFAILPWLLLSTIYYLQNSTSKNLIIFSIITLMSSPQGFIPPLFIIYFLFLLIFAAFYLLTNKAWQSVKKVIVLLGVTILINSYWLLPVVGYSLGGSNIYLNSYNNIMTTEDFVLKSKKFGTLGHLINLKGFIYDAVDATGAQNIFYIFQPWKDHLNNPIVVILSLYIFIFILVGIYVCLRKKYTFSIPLAVCLLLTLVLLATDLFPFSYLSEILRNNVPIFRQAFRIAFTKLSISAALLYSIFFGTGVYALLLRLEKIGAGQFKRMQIIMLALFMGMILFVSLPSFRGNFIYNRVRLDIPKEYFDLFNFFQKQPNGRIANFPQFIPTGWSIYRWGYSGSGFLWYGISQPILDRNFDVWSNFNENYYWELVDAIYAQDLNRFSNVLKKYNISWVVIDRNIVGYVSPRALYNDQLEEMIGQLGSIKKVESFGNINVYKVNLSKEFKDFVFLGRELPEVGPSYNWNNYDKAYQEYGNYISLETQSPNVKSQNPASPAGRQNSNLKPNTQPDVYYPFRSLFTGRQQSELEFGIYDKQDYFSFTAKIPKNLEGSSLLIPPIVQDEVTEIDANNLDNITVKYPQVFLDGEFLTSLQNPQAEIPLGQIKDGSLEIRVPKIGGYYSANLEPFDFAQGKPKNCDQFNEGVYKHDLIKENGQESLRLTSVGSSNCLDFDLPNLAQRNSYLVSVNSRNVEGKSLLFALINKNSGRADIETYLREEPRTKNQELRTSFYVIPPMEQFGVGYSLHLDNISIGREKTVNDLGKISVNPIPYQFLTSIKIMKNNQILWGAQDDNVTKLNVEHPNPSYYELGIMNYELGDNNTTLVLSQSYDDGWRAYEITNDWLTDSWYMKLLIPLFGKELKNHVEVNNWENGWTLSNLELRTKNREPVTIAIFYLPQYLEYLGFVILGGFGLYLLIFRKGKFTADKRFSNKQATFTGPTPPGTGV